MCSEKGNPLVSDAISNFVRQQGLSDVPEASCGSHYSALSFQPRLLGILILVAIVLQSGPLFLTLSALQWWNAILPRWNPFDHLYNALFASRAGTSRLKAAPAPRRFSMGMAASFMLGIGVSLMAGLTTLAVVLQVFLGAALLALVLGKFCMGSYIYHLLRGNAAFANRTLPWSRGPQSQA